MRLAPLVLMAALLGFAACARPVAPVRGESDPLVYDEAAVKRADKIAILVPGALVSAAIFDPALAWEREGYAIVRYRFPGKDGLPLDHKLSVEDAGRRIASFANLYPDKKIRLFGYSTGGAVVIAAAPHLVHDDVRLAAVAPAPPRGGGASTLVRGALDLGAAAGRAGSLGGDALWREYMKTMLFGRPGLRDPVLKARADRIVAAIGPDLVRPDPALVAAHTDGLRAWRPEKRRAPGPARFYVGADDPVFGLRQTLALARRIGGAEVYAYPRNGHLLFITSPRLFDDVLAYFEGDG